METKTCSKCGRELPISEFYKAKGYKDGHRNECKDCFKERYKQYYQENRKDIAEQQKQYYQEKKDEILERQKQYDREHKDEKKQYYQANRESILGQHKQYYQTPNGRATYLVHRYSQSDKEHNRGECTITPEWVIDNIFTQPCHWCGETDWTKLGCDRIDNSKPHTPDNVIPCCEECNTKRGRRTYEEYSLMI